MIIEVAFVCLVCRYRRRDLGESLRMATGCALRALHQAERLEEIGSVPAIRPGSTELWNENNVGADRAEVKPFDLNVLLTISR